MPGTAAYVSPPATVIRPTRIGPAWMCERGSTSLPTASIAQNTENARVTDSMATKAADEAAEEGMAVSKTVEDMKSIANRISIIDDIAVSNRGSVIQFLPDKRTLDSGFPITRSIRDWFLTFTGRKIVRSVEVLMDAGKKIGTLLNPATTKGSTGKTYTPDDREQDRMWCSVSFDRANSFGPRRMRNLGRSDNNAFVVIWRNLGSGNNFAIEFGTSANYRFQIYQVDIQVQ